MLHTIIDKLWYGNHPLRWLLWPFTLIYCFFMTLRRVYLKQFCQQQASVPIIVVGNLTVGGVGKTPLVIALAHAFLSRGLRVGIVSRGYGASVNHYPYEVTRESMAVLVGDEPLLLAKKTGCPVVIAPKRWQAVQYLLDNYQSQLIISDDGLQHYAMGRAIEIVVIDGSRGLGNGLCLPAGPLREGESRLQTADFVVVNGVLSNRLDVIGLLEKQLFQMDLVPGHLTQLVNGKTIDLSELTAPVAAIAAIGNPMRFFETLKKMGVAFKEYPFRDHHQFKPDELVFEEKSIVMTEKDAVKCLPFATDEMYFLPVDAKMDDQFWDFLWTHKQLQGNHLK